MERRHRRALFWTLGLAAILAGPFAFRIWLESEAGQVALPQLGEVEPFVLRDRANEAVTKEALRRAVTIVIHIPESCGSDCELAVKQAHEVEQWIQENLTMTYAEEKNPLHLFVSGGGYRPTGSQWRELAEVPPEGSLLPRGYTPDKSWLVVIDPWLVFGGAWDLTQPVDRKKLARVLSRTTFEQYMGNYLARRTFMGPKRDAR